MMLSKFFLMNKGGAEIAELGIVRPGKVAPDSRGGQRETGQRATIIARVVPRCQVLRCPHLPYGLALSSSAFSVAPNKVD